MYTRCIYIYYLAFVIYRPNERVRSKRIQEFVDKISDYYVTLRHYWFQPFVFV